MESMDELIRFMDELAEDVWDGDMFRKEIAESVQDDFKEQFDARGIDEFGNYGVWRENSAEYEDWKNEWGYIPDLMQASGKLRHNMTSEIEEQMEIIGGGKITIIWESINVPNEVTGYGTWGATPPGGSYAAYYQETDSEKRKFIITPQGLEAIAKAMSGKIQKRMEALA